MKTTSFRGIWPAMLTPLRENLTVDHEKFVAHGKSLLESGCSGLTPFGTTGEGASFDATERMHACEALVKGGINASQLIFSVSSSSVAEVLKLTKHAVKLGAHGVLMLPPFYFKGVSDEGILNSFRYVIDRVNDSRLKLYVYHLPQVCAVPLSHHVIETLKCEYPQVIAGIKDSECSSAHSVALAERFASELSVYVGNELDLRTMARLGTQGAISGIANFWPRQVAQLVAEPDAPTSDAIHAQMQTFLDAVKTYSLLPALKMMMAWQTGDDAWLRVRPPLVALTPEIATQLKQQLERLSLGVS